MIVRVPNALSLDDISSEGTSPDPTDSARLRSLFRLADADGTCRGISCVPKAHMYSLIPDTRSKARKHTMAALLLAERARSKSVAAFDFDALGPSAELLYSA